ncbi:hypothetical protein NF556_14795 [Ornithinimicrobium faecis]|uniref:Uncharacterized protein n=1 Tax=Ornithinimicrobium faecis TaxID=2934158 RepID=A0ABY4YQV2_9MICO|nr:hypothetical protein [Ornithinimicrobium sp. HY1793]USQ78885.1 hypothetical protein NF556_14795 [Ornithinimicrobium sp. HY1793]
MSALALLLIAVGLSDLIAARGWSDRHTGRRVGALAGLASVAALALLAGLTGWGDLALLTIAGLTTGGWVVLAGRADDSDLGQGLALAALAAGTALSVLLSGWATPAGGALGRWLEWTGIEALAGADPTRVLLLVGLVLAQLSTGNVIVRLVLAHTGALNPLGGPQASDRLRGGRLLGPMERVFILGLGLAGQVTAASIVIAAKGLIRWPELQRASRDSERLEQAARDTPDARKNQAASTASIDQVTEYFLIGSFVSWLVALVALVVAHLG